MDDFAFNPADFRPVALPAMLSSVFDGVSKSEARRLIDAGSLKVEDDAGNMVKWDDGYTAVARDLDGRVIRLGKRRWARMRVA